MSDIKSDLVLFNELAEALINEEQKNPVAERIEANELYSSIDLSLNQSPMIDDEFKTLLREILISTPKTATRNPRSLHLRLGSPPTRSRFLHLQIHVLDKLLRQKNPRRHSRRFPQRLLHLQLLLLLDRHLHIHRKRGISPSKFCNRNPDACPKSSDNFLYLQGEKINKKI